MIQPTYQGKMSSRDFVYETVKKNILLLTLKPGQMISEKEIAEKLQVSRTPTREAFIKLAEEDLITVYPQKGSFISLIDIEHVEEARFLREHMEVAILKIACETFTEKDLDDLEMLLSQQRLYSGNHDMAKLHELDEQFHETFFVKCGKQKTWLVIQRMYTHYKRFRNLLLAVYFDWEMIIQQHTRLVEHIRNRDFPSAEQELRVHVQSRFEKEELFKKYPDYFKSAADKDSFAL